MLNESVRKEFPLLEKITHLASASRGPMPRSTVEKILRTVRGLQTKDPSVEHECEHLSDRCRKLGSRLLGCEKEEIGLVFNTTHGINAFASGIHWRRGDSVVIPDVEYPANVAPWVRQADRGVRVKIVSSINGEVPIESFKKAIDSNTRVVAVSHVEFGNGFKNDLAALSELAHGSGALLFVDAAQSLGVVGINPGKLGIDALSSCGYKWLCGPAGTGIMYVREDLIPEISPRYMGFESISSSKYDEMFKDLARDGWRADMNYPFSSYANRFEFGETSSILLMGFASSMEFLLGFGLRRIEERSRILTDYLISRLDDRGMNLQTPRDPARRAGIVTFIPARCKGGNMVLAAELARRGVFVSARAGGIRVSCHFFSNENDIDVLMDFVRDLTT